MFERPCRGGIADRASGKRKADHSANFFSHTNADANAERERLAAESLESLITWLKKEGGNVGIMGGSHVRRLERC